MSNERKTLAGVEQDVGRLRAQIVADMAKARTATWADVLAVQTEAVSLASDLKLIARDQADDAKAAVVSAVEALEAAGAIVQKSGQTAAHDVGRAHADLLSGATRAVESLGLAHARKAVS
jgi:hypothetical protein